MSVWAVLYPCDSGSEQDKTKKMQGEFKVMIVGFGPHVPEKLEQCPLVSMPNVRSSSGPMQQPSQTPPGRTPQWAKDQLKSSRFPPRQCSPPLDAKSKLHAGKETGYKSREGRASKNFAGAPRKATETESRKEDEAIIGGGKEGHFRNTSE